MKTAAKLGVTEREIAKLCDAVISALTKSPLDPAELRDVLGPAVRNLGEEGKRKGLTTTLPVALGKLQAEGEIRRIPTNGRLDQQRYRYTVWRPNPLSKFKLSVEEVNIELARRYFTWIGPATLGEFQWFSGLGVKSARSAMEPLQLEPLAKGDDRLLLPGDREAWESFRVPKDPQYALVSSLDGLVLLRRDLRGMLEAGDFERKVPVEKGKDEIGRLADLSSHAIVDRGRLVGVWEFDTATESIVWLPFVAKNTALTKAVERTQEYVRSQLGTPDRSAWTAASLANRVLPPCAPWHTCNAEHFAPTGVQSFHGESCIENPSISMRGGIGPFGRLRQDRSRQESCRDQAGQQ